MIIRRRYRFYASHRNRALNDKCSRLHGHRYGVEVDVRVEPSGAGVGMLFADIDARLAPVFELWDHRTLLRSDDPLAQHIEGAVLLPFESSVENLSAYLLRRCFQEIPQVVALSLQETDSATVHATLEDLKSWPTLQ